MKVDGVGMNPNSIQPIGSTSAEKTPVDSGTAEVKNTSVTRDSVLVTINGKSISQLTHMDKMEMTVSDKVMIEAIERANRAIMGANKEFIFSIHEATKQIQVKVLDKDTKEVLREIPSDKVLDMVAKMWEMAGIMVDERR